MKRFRPGRPSPAMVVALIALVVACAGSATAAVLIRSSSQIKNGIITGSDIKNGSIKLGELSSSARDAVTRAAESTQIKTREASRKFGPVVDRFAGDQTVATLTGLEAGSYVITAKVNMTIDKVANTNSACHLAATGDDDFSKSTSGSLSRNDSALHILQMTRTFSGTGTAILSCNSNDNRWSAENTSIIATKVSTVQRQAVEG